MLIIVVSLFVAVLAAPFSNNDLRAEKSFQHLPDQFKVLGAHSVIRSLYGMSDEKIGAIKTAAKAFADDKDAKKLNAALESASADFAKTVAVLQKQFDMGLKGHESNNVKQFAAKCVALGNKAIVELLSGDTDFKDINDEVAKLSASFVAFTSDEKADYEQQWPQMFKLFQQNAEHPKRNLLKDGDDAAEAQLERMPDHFIDSKAHSLISEYGHLSAEKKVQVAAAAKTIKNKSDVEEAARLIASIAPELSKKMEDLAKTDKAALQKLDGKAKEFAEEVINRFQANIVRMLNAEAAFDKKTHRRLFQAEFNALTKEEQDSIEGALPNLAQFFKRHASEVPALTEGQLKDVQSHAGDADRTSGKQIEEVEKVYGALPKVLQVKPLHSLIMVLHHLDSLTKTRVAEKAAAYKSTTSFDEFVSDLEVISKGVFHKLSQITKSVAEQAGKVNSDARAFLKKFQPAAVSTLLEILRGETTFKSEAFDSVTADYTALPAEAKKSIEENIPSLHQNLN